MGFYFVYSLTFYFFAVQESLVVLPKVDGSSVDFQKIRWPNEKKLSDRPLCTDETCRSIVRLFSSKRSCLSSCLRTLNDADTQKTRNDRPAPPPPTPGLTEGTLGDCMHRPCLQNDDRITRQESSDADDVTAMSSAPPSDESPTSEGGEEDKNAATGSEPPEVEDAKQLFRNAKRSLKKRGYTDPTDLCIQFHCSNRRRGTLGYLKCVKDYRCSNGRR